MQLSRTDLADFVYFLAIAKHRSFRQAALETGVTTSALSHAIRALETRRGVRLLNRTTRSVTLTAAGEELRASIEAPLQAVSDAAENLNRFRDAPAGRVRINVLEDAVELLLKPVMRSSSSAIPRSRSTSASATAWSTSSPAASTPASVTAGPFRRT